VPIAGKASDIRGAPPEENATTAAYRAQHDSSVAAYNRAISMAQQTAGTPASAVYLKIAEDAAKAANDVNLKAIEYGSRQTRNATASELGRGIIPMTFKSPTASWKLRRKLLAGPRS
jgi:hypothetical protein